MQDLDDYYDTLKQLALGVWVEDEEKGRVYQRPPDRQALETLISHAKGKPATTQASTPDTQITFISKVPRPRRPCGDNEGGVQAGLSSEGPGGYEEGSAGVAAVGGVHDGNG